MLTQSHVYGWMMGILCSPAKQPHKEKTLVSPVSFGWNVGVGVGGQSDFRHGGWASLFSDKASAVLPVTKLFCRFHLACQSSLYSLDSFIHWECSSSKVTAAQEISVQQTDRAASGLSNGQQVLNLQPINTRLSLDLPQKAFPTSFQTWWLFPLVNVSYLTR